MGKYCSEHCHLEEVWWVKVQRIAAIIHLEVVLQVKGHEIAASGISWWVWAAVMVVTREACTNESSCQLNQFPLFVGLTLNRISDQKAYTRVTVSVYICIMSIEST